MKETHWYTLDIDRKHIAKHRSLATKLKKSQWWLTRINQGVCGYCHKKFGSSDLTMDHIVPLARGGTSTKGNVVPSCKQCNVNKKLHTPVDQTLINQFPTNTGQ